MVLTAGLTEALAEGLGDGLGLGSSVGVGVGLGDGLEVSPSTSGEEGKKVVFRKKPEPIRMNSKTAERIKVGREGLLRAINCIIHYFFLLNFYWNLRAILY